MSKVGSLCFVLALRTDMKYRKLRIAWSVAWGVAFLILTALWTQDGGVYLHGYLPGVSSFAITSWCFPGSIWTDTISVGVIYGWHAQNGAQWEIGRIALIMGEKPEGFYLSFDPNSSGLVALIPHWFLALAFVASALLPWTPTISRLRRFSLRTLLIATTLVAAGLGLIVCVKR